MNRTENNLLLNLFYGTWKKDENFHTEALVHLVRHLLQHEPVAAVNILKAITGGVLNLASQDTTSISINTQVTTSGGFRPDIEIKTAEHLIYVEVKVESRLHDSQLEEYRKALLESRLSKTCLAFLTKYPFDLEKSGEKPDITIRWYQIAEWLEFELEQKTIQQSLSIYITEQFLGFLNQRGLMVERVSKELIPGLQSLLNLVVMLEESLRLIRASSIKFDIQWEWVGYRFKFDSQQYWIGLRYDRPNILFVEIDEIAPAIYEQLNLGYVYYEEEYEDWCWIHELDLSSEESMFFELSKSAQLQYIEQFLVETLSAVKQIQP